MVKNAKAGLFSGHPTEPKYQNSSWLKTCLKNLVGDMPIQVNPDPIDFHLLQIEIQTI